MDTPSPFFAALLAMTFVIAGLVKGVTGMGLPTIAMGLMGSIMPPATAAALLVIPSLVTNVWQLLAGPASARLVRRLWPMMAAVAVGTTASTALLARIDATLSGLALGIALMAYAAYALWAPAWSLPPRTERWLSPLAGLITGIVTGATGVFVMPAVPYLQSLRLEKDELVQALGLSFTVSTLALAAGLLAHDALPARQLGWSAAAVVPALAGMWWGQAIRARIGARTFRRCFLLLLCVLGLELALRPLL
ncbi:MAG: sulfite exporter TauE/SafE family protein [Rhodocyclaceae bacterium]